MAGIALGVAALIVVLSVMNGFQEELRNRILSVASHIEIRGVPTLGRRRRDRARGDGQPAREGRGTLRDGPGDALRRRGESRRDHPRHRSGARRRGRRHRRAHARGSADGPEARRIRDRPRRGARARARRAGGRTGRRDHAAGHDDARRHAAAPEDVPRRRRVRGRNVRVRQRPRADRHRRREEALSPGRRVGRAPQARRPVRRARGRARARGDAQRRRRDPRLDAQPRQFLPRGADREARDVHHPDADHRRRRVQHRVGAGDDGHGQGRPTSRSCARWARRRRRSRRSS